MVAKKAMPVQVVALDDFGGLQTLFVSLMHELSMEGVSPLVINRANAKPLEFFENQLTGCNVNIFSPACTKTVNAIKVMEKGFGEDFIRKIKSKVVTHSMRRKFSKENGQGVVLWNVLPKKEYTGHSGPTVVYDHGMSSIQKNNKENKKRLKAANKVVTVSKANSVMLSELWDWKGPVSVVPNPLRHSIANSTLIEKQGKTAEDKIILGCASRLISFKGVTVAIHAVKALRESGYNVNLRICGIGPELDALKALVATLNMNNYIFFDGLIEDMVSFYSRIDIFLAMSLREPFGLSPLEAIASGVPSIVSRVDGHDEICPESRSLILLEPSLSAKEYLELGGSNYKMPRKVYSPSQGTCIPPKSVAPYELSCAIKVVIENYKKYAEDAFVDANFVRKANSMSSYVEKYKEAIVNGFQ